MLEFILDKDLKTIYEVIPAGTKLPLQNGYVHDQQGNMLFYIGSNAAFAHGRMILTEEAASKYESGKSVYDGENNL